MPLLMTGLATGLAFGLVSVDQDVRYRDIRGYEWIFLGGVNGARAVLSAISSSMISVNSITFSLTMVVLSLTSGQFGPRLLRNFIYDIRTQAALGTFIATYIYCLLVLRTIRGVDDEEFVPYIAVNVGVGLAILSIGMLIFYIHHVALSIQAPKVIDAAYRELEASVDRLFPEKVGVGARSSEALRGAGDIPEGFEERAAPVAAPTTGYLQAVDPGRIIGVAEEDDVLLRLTARPGDHVVEGQALARAWPPERAGEDLDARVNRALVIGGQRTPVQDIRFSFNQLTEIALFALSSGINDPHTALSCIDYLAAGLCRLADRTPPSEYRYDDSGRLRVIAKSTYLAEIVDRSFSQIRQHGSGNGQVMARLLEAIRTVGPCVHRDEDRDALLRQAEAIHQTGRETLPLEQDQQLLRSLYEEAAAAVGAGAD